MGTTTCSFSVHSAFGASIFSWHLANRPWSWPPAHLLYEKSILSIQWVRKCPDQMVGFHALLLCGTRTLYHKGGRSVYSGTHVMVGKVEYYSPGSNTTLSKLICFKNWPHLAHCHWFPWRALLHLGIWFILCYSLCCSPSLEHFFLWLWFVSCVWVWKAESVTLASSLRCYIRFSTEKK